MSVVRSILVGARHPERLPPCRKVVGFFYSAGSSAIPWRRPSADCATWISVPVPRQQADDGFLGCGLLGANIAFAVAVAACPLLAPLLSVELLNHALKRHRFRAATFHSFRILP
jgi:hypothetical protein